MRRTRMLIAAVLLTAGCAAPEHYVGSETRDLVGQPVLTAVDRLGSPSERIKQGNETVYVWTIRSRQPRTTGYVAQGGQLIPLKWSEGLLSNDSCSLRIIATNADNLIRRWEAEGNRKSCRRLLERLG